MVNDNAFELSDEQLEVVTGGADSPVNVGSVLSNLNLNINPQIAVAPTANISLFNIGGTLGQSGATAGQGSGNLQTGTNH